ncbi:MAG: pyridoxine 5'-phosphate synthase [Gammaproteobacteria bacterium]|nr:pyridoxine 5'-phosphate synthase [Gammaproteobacteria bacterium]
MNSIKLGVNIDHIATLREARGTDYPSPIEGALIAVEAGADGITLHLREDRRHIQDQDVFTLKAELAVPMNLEMATTKEMVTIAAQLKPAHCCLVPEKREELTTEGGLNVVDQLDHMQTVCSKLADAGIEVSLFIDPEQSQIDAAKACGAPTIELHTGEYANAKTPEQQTAELARIQSAADYAAELGLIVNAGHGLTVDNVANIAAISVMNELNIGHSIIARAVFIGLREAIAEIKTKMLAAQG